MPSVCITSGKIVVVRRFADSRLDWLWQQQEDEAHDPLWPQDFPCSEP